MPDLTISIVNTNNRGLLDRCLGTIYETTKKISFEVFVVDNACSDGSADMVREKYPGVKLLLNSERKGFTANHNQVLRAMNGDYVLLLNEDTEIGAGCLDEMLEYLEEHPDVGALGCRILNPDGSAQNSIHRIPTLGALFSHALMLSYLFPRSIRLAGYKKWGYDEIREVPFMIGAILMLPRRVIDKIGLLDEQFFLYMDDPDLCKRVRDAGWKVVFYPNVEIMHYGGVEMARMSDRAFHNSFRSMHFFFKKHYGAWTLPFMYLSNITGAAARILIWSAVKFVRPGKRAAYSERIDYFKRVIAWHLALKYRLPP